MPSFRPKKLSSAVVDSVVVLLREIELLVEVVRLEAGGKPPVKWTETYKILGKIWKNMGRSINGRSQKWLVYKGKSYING